ncbi:hypothetical protein ABFS83_01G106600 [Erythranthe nasuta]
MALIGALVEILEKPSVVDVMIELMVFMAPIWIAVFIGVLVGWAWKPNWANSSNKSVSLFPQFASSVSNLSSFKVQFPACIPWVSDQHDSPLPPVSSAPHYSLSELEKEKSSVVNDEDLIHLHKLVEEKDGGPAWIKMMDRSTPNMSYQAWRRDAESGPPQYRSRTIYEDATPETLRDFFWDDEFRAEWDDMLIKANTLNECRSTGTMLVQWVRKFPFFCSDREYIIGRRIWESGKTYYCVTKGVPCSSVPRLSKPRRVDLYYSSWFVRAAESRRDGSLSACEVVLFHHEDMGIPYEIAKLGIRQGMWGAVKKIDPGLRAYQKHRASSTVCLSPSVQMAQINTKVNIEILEEEAEESQDKNTSIVPQVEETRDDKPAGKGIPKIMVVGGAIALAYTLDRGLLTKALIFGVARRFAKTGRRL